MRSFVKIKPSRNGEITLSFTDVVNHVPVAIFNVVNMFLALFAKIKFSRTSYQQERMKCVDVFADTVI